MNLEDKQFKNNYNYNINNNINNFEYKNFQSGLKINKNNILY